MIPPGAAQPTGSLAEPKAAFKAHDIAVVLEKCRGNPRKAAEIPQMPGWTLADKIRRHGLTSVL